MAKAGEKRAVVIAGPTGSGKSRAAMEIARRLGGVIINADAMQVYRELSILTARPAPEDEAAIPHRLYGFVSITEPWSAGRHLAAARDVLAEVWDAGQTPVIVGGTGLYIRALEQGLAEVPPIPEAVRKHWRARLAAEGAAALHAELARLSADEAARLSPGDAQRIVRALEVLEATGEPLAAFQTRGDAGAALDGVAVARLAILPERERLYAAIEARFDAMMAAGALAEAHHVMRISPAPALPAPALPAPVLPALRAIGLAPLIAHLRDGLPLAAAVETAKRDSRRYAKRQATWIRGQMRHFTVVASPGGAVESLDAAWTSGLSPAP
jgi:tRNA dimethylallyltransferase